MARPDELVPGNCYFHVNYFDDKLLFPSVDTLTFVRADEYESGERVWIFQSPSEPEESGGTDSSANGERTPVGFTDEQLYQILDFPGLVSVLNEVAVDHPLKKSSRSANDQQSTTGAFDELRDNVK